MGIKWKNKVKKWMAEVLLGVLLIAPAVSSAEMSQTEIFQTEVNQEQENSSGGSLPGGSPAAGELPGEDGDDGAGIRPCGEPEDDKKAVDNQ